MDPVRRGSLARWPRAADAVLAAVLFVLTLLLTGGAGDCVGLRDVGAVPLWIVLLLAVAVAGAAVTDPAPRACLERHTRSSSSSPAEAAASLAWIGKRPSSSAPAGLSVLVITSPVCWRPPGRLVSSP